MKKILAATSLLFTAPALAETPAATPAATAVVMPADKALADRLRVSRQANHWEAAYLVLSAVDVAQTCDFLKRGVAYETNPLFGKHPKCSKLVGFKLIGGGIHYGLFSYLKSHNPRFARTLAQFSVGVQGAVVGLNFEYTFKGR